MSDTFYFVIFTDASEQTLSVIDLAYCVDYERWDWNCVDGEDFNDLSEAIIHAKSLASKYGRKYRRFESRYDSNLNEPKLT